MLVPEWWGVKLAHVGPRGAIHFADARRPRDNASVDIQAIAGLLWRDEALDLLRDIDTIRGFRSKPRAAIYSRIAEVADIDIVRSRVRQQLISRTNWRSGERQMSNDD